VKALGVGDLAAHDVGEGLVELDLEIPARRGELQDAVIPRETGVGALVDFGVGTFFFFGDDGLVVAVVFVVVFCPWFCFRSDRRARCPLTRDQRRTPCGKPHRGGLLERRWRR